jgi:hypothetical protein
MGRDAYQAEIDVENLEVKEEGDTRVTYIKKEKKLVDFFAWEKLDYVDKVKEAFGL